jgi:phosphate starvation-inducible PhoH-like protein
MDGLQVRSGARKFHEAPSKEPPLKAQDGLNRFTRTEVRPREGLAETAEIKLSFDDNKLAGLVFGHYDQNLAHLERRIGVTAHVNGNQVTIKGAPDVTEQARRILEGLYDRVRQAGAISTGDVDGMIEEQFMQGSLFPEGEEVVTSFDEVGTRKRRVRARNAAQHRYLKLLKKHELVFAEGPAGTGKTWLAVGHAVQLLEQGAVERLILSRPAVEAGERLGFLPGDMREKVDPYLRPIYDALYDFMEARHVERGLQTGMIEIAPLAFMRGRTLSNAFVIVDEAQNATQLQMKMVLTRLGEGSRMVVTGDPSQVDLPRTDQSGLAHAVSILEDVRGVEVIRFATQDVVRHRLVAQIVEAYHRDEGARGGG